MTCYIRDDQALCKKSLKAAEILDISGIVDLSLSRNSLQDNGLLLPLYALCTIPSVNFFCLGAAEPAPGIITTACNLNTCIDLNKKRH
jgi:hypothetical protein